MRMQLNRFRGNDGHAGQALIEFALVAPILLLILFAIFDVGKALNYLNDETNLANVAARYASVANQPICTCNNFGCSTTTNGGKAPDLYAYIACQAQTDSGQFGSGVGVCLDDVTTAGAFKAGDALKVTVIYPYKFLTFISGVVHQPSVTLTSSATMMLESAPASTTWLSGTNTDTNNPNNTSSPATGYTACT